MAFLGAAARAGLSAVGSSGKPGRRRRRPSRRLTTSELAIRRAESRRKRKGSGFADRGPRRVKGNPTRGVPSSRGPSRPTRGRTTRSINTGSSRRRRSPLARALRGRMQKGRCK